MNRNVRVVIHGTPGVGKSSAALGVAKSLRLKLIDSGLMYHAVAWVCSEHDIRIQDPELVRQINSLQFDFKTRTVGMRVIAKGSDITDQLGRADESSMASEVTQLTTVRNSLDTHQNNLARRFGRNSGWVAEGIHLSRGVLDRADTIISLTATVEERAYRLRAKLRERGIDISLDESRKKIAQRDRTEDKCHHAILNSRKDVEQIKTDGLSLEAVVKKIIVKISTEPRKDMARGRELEFGGTSESEPDTLTKQEPETPTKQEPDIQPFEDPSTLWSHERILKKIEARKRRNKSVVRNKSDKGYYLGR